MNRQQRLLRRAEACERLGISASTLKRLIAAGELREIAIGRSRRLPEDEIGRYIEAKSAAA